MDEVRRQRVITRVRHELEATESLLAYLHRTLLDATRDQDVALVKRRIRRAADLRTHLKSKQLKALERDDLGTQREGV